MRMHDSVTIEAGEKKLTDITTSMKKWIIICGNMKNFGKFFEIIAMRSDSNKDYIWSYLPRYLSQDLVILTCLSILWPLYGCSFNSGV